MIGPTPTLPGGDGFLEGLEAGFPAFEAEMAAFLLRSEVTSSALSHLHSAESCWVRFFSDSRISLCTIWSARSCIAAEEAIDGAAIEWTEEPDGNSGIGNSGPLGPAGST